MTADYLLRINQIIPDGAAAVSVVGIRAPDGFGGILTLSPESGRMTPGDYQRAINTAGVNGYILAYQMDTNGSCSYVTKLKAAGEAKRVFHAPALNVTIFHADQQNRKVALEAPWDLFTASRSYGQKLTMLATVTKTDAVVINGIEGLVAEMMGLFNSLQSQSYTPKLILLDALNGKPIEVYGSRNPEGLLDWSLTERYVRNNDRVLSMLSAGPVMATRSVVIRLSDRSTKSKIDRMLKAAAPGRTNHIVEWFFKNSRRDGIPLFAPGVVVTGVGNGYEYGEKAEMLRDGKTIGEFLNG